MTEAETRQREALGYRTYHGVEFPPKKIGGNIFPMPEWKAEGLLYLDEDNEFCKSKSYLGKAEHFKRFVKIVWGDPSDEGYFQWNPNAERMIELAVQHRFLAIAGCASSGKSRFLALYAVAHFILRPKKTKAIITSMTIQTAEGKVWGDVKKMWRRACRFMEIKDEKGNVILEGEKYLGGKLLDSMHIIKRRSPDGTLHSTEGIELLPAEAGEFKKSATKMQGYKAGFVYLLADELATLAPNILDTAKENLFSNTYFQLIGAFNPESHTDPGGLISEPVGGWDSIDHNSMEWATRFATGGWCVRFDGTQSPNIIPVPNNKWLGLTTVEILSGYRTMYPDESSAGFWKMVRGYWSPTGSADCIYSETELENGGCLRPIKVWVGNWKMVAGFDPAWTAGGDNAVGVFGRVGEAVIPEFGGARRTVWEHVETCIFDERVGVKDSDKPTQIAKQFAEKCRKHSVATEDVALDITGGHAFATVLALEIGRGFMALNFGGSASDLPMPKPDKRTCKEAFRNLMSELWYSCKSLVRQGQIRNLPPANVNEMISRTYDSKSGKITVEPKDKMKSRIRGRSPDRADATFLSIFMARRKHNLMGNENFPTNKKTAERQDPYANLTAWGKKKTRTITEQPFCDQTMGVGGWGSMDQDTKRFGGMFGGGR